uniref:Transmembrane 9 superfamily member n=1 Tax=Pyxicephalus adspersus TaxID=30357 RepID=A0AAV3B611_PYXAD|nr:TPA: hypothetical protein GDO54_000841 [Pyxicephalus adspersus]
MASSQRINLLVLLLALAACMPRPGSAFYLPGLAPVSFCEPGKQTEDCKQGLYYLLLPKLILYFYLRFDFCPSKEGKRPSENLGQVLFGERIEPSPYKFKFKENKKCEDVCVKKYTSDPESKQKLEFLKKSMLLNYQHHWIVDNMPVTWCYEVEEKQKFCNPGFPIGCYITQDGHPKDACVINSEFHERDTYYIFNHVDITIYYHVVEDEAKGSRLEDAQEEFGWKLVHGDVFRPPRKGMLLSVFLGSGAQILIMTFVTLFFACLGFLSPANRGALMTCAVVLWVLLGTPAGYVASRFYKSFGGEKWKTNVLLTAFLCPGIVFADFFLMNLILWGEGSSAAIPFGTLVAILALWFCISVPLTFIGAYFGFKKNVRTIGFFACFWFVTKIYSVVKVD